eukprot:scaffold6107_cov130-Isochrysis_galbana.AAC.8
MPGALLGAELNLLPGDACLQLVTDKFLYVTDVGVPGGHHVALADGRKLLLLRVRLQPEAKLKLPRLQLALLGLPPYAAPPTAARGRQCCPNPGGCCLATGLTGEGCRPSSPTESLCARTRCPRLASAPTGLHLHRLIADALPLPLRPVSLLLPLLAVVTLALRRRLLGGRALPISVRARLFGLGLPWLNLVEERLVRRRHSLLLVSGSQQRTHLLGVELPRPPGRDRPPAGRTFLLADAQALFDANGAESVQTGRRHWVTHDIQADGAAQLYVQQVCADRGLHIG